MFIAWHMSVMCLYVLGGCVHVCDCGLTLVCYVCMFGDVFMYVIMSWHLSVMCVCFWGCSCVWLWVDTCLWCVWMFWGDVFMYVIVGVHRPCIDVLAFSLHWGRVVGCSLGKECPSISNVYARVHGDPPVSTQAQHTYGRIVGARCWVWLLFGF